MATDIYGVGIDGISDLPLRFNLAGGFKNLGNNLSRRLQTPRGSLSWAPDDGYDVRQLLSAGLTTNQLRSAESAISNECGKDERVQACTATVSYVPAESRLTINLAIETEDGPFVLVLGVDALSVAILNAAVNQ